MYQCIVFQFMYFNMDPVYQFNLVFSRPGHKMLIMYFAWQIIQKRQKIINWRWLHSIHRTCSASRRLTQSARPGSRGRGQLLFGSERAQYFLPYQWASCSGHVWELQPGRPVLPRCQLFCRRYVGHYMSVVFFKFDGYVSRHIRLITISTLNGQVEISSGRSSRGF